MPFVPCGASRSPGLPPARGELSDRLFWHLAQDPHDVEWKTVADSDDGDFQLALYCCYELHYRGFDGVEAEWEWEPSLLAVRRQLERRFEADLRQRAEPAAATDPAEVPVELWRIARGGDGPSLSGWLTEHGTMFHLRELAIHRSAYQLKEADPHTWGIPRLSGAAKAVMAHIQADEYGAGDWAAMHSALFADTMSSLGLDTTPNAYLALIPGGTLATTNAISLMGLHRRLRGALVGHLALFEMTSVGPMGRYSGLLERLGVGDAGRRFYDVHVDADQVHQHLAVDGMVRGLMADEPELASDVLLGARILQTIEARMTAALLGAWRRGRSSLLGTHCAVGTAC